jgi:hypothetical protein
MINRTVLAASIALLVFATMAPATAAVAAGSTTAASDTTKPVARITSPRAGAVIAGTVTISTTATDKVGVTSVSIWSGSTKLGTSLKKPGNVWEFTMPTAAYKNATHGLIAKARDKAGNVGVSAKVSVVVKNVVASPPVAEWTFAEPVAPFAAANGAFPLAQAGKGLATSVSTPWGKGINFKGNSFLRLPQESIGALNIGAVKNTVTVAAWVNLTDTNTGFVAGTWQEDNNDPRRSYGLFYDLNGYGGNDRANFHVSKTGGPTVGYEYSRDYSSTPTKFTRGAWQLHVGTYDGTYAISYLDGEAKSYPKYTDSLGNTYAKNPYFYPDGLNSAPGDFTVGAVELTTGPGNFAVGTFAKIRVWDRALTAAEVLALYTAEKAAL